MQKNGTAAKSSFVISLVITFFVGSVLVSYFFFERCQARDEVLERTALDRENNISRQLDYRCTDLKDRINDNKVLIQEVRADIKKLGDKISEKNH
jgi:hypothetical protein